MTFDELSGRISVCELRDDERWNQRQREVDGELTFTLNLLDQVEDETRRSHVELMDQIKRDSEHACPHGVMYSGYCWQSDGEDMRRSRWYED